MKLADAFTFVSLASSLLALALGMLGYVEWAGTLLLLSVLLDWLDGRIARHFRQESQFGMHLDSLVDICAFGMVPFALALVIGGITPLLFASGLIFVGAGVYRLARFQAKKLRSFQGMPITMNGVFFALILLFYPGAFALYFVVAAVLMVCTFKVRKLG